MVPHEPSAEKRARGVWIVDGAKGCRPFPRTPFLASGVLRRFAPKVPTQDFS
jgi:hypothetical protein